MRRCAACAVGVEGGWTACPLCGAPLSGEATADPFPAVALRFSRRRVLRVLFLVSIAVILASLSVQLLFDRRPAGIGALRSVWLGVVTMWLVVVMAVRKRHNVAKGTVYLVVIAGLFVVEMLSVVIQIAVFKTRHVRVFKMAPFHHHFELSGWAETTVMVRFWLLAAMSAALGLGLFYAEWLSLTGG